MNTSRRRFLVTGAMTLAAGQSVTAYRVGNLLPRLGLPVGAGAASAAAGIPVFTVERWVNSAPLTADTLRGKVVLVDFWEYTCVNWIRTAPYVKAWHRDYADRGLVVVGVHAPEFEFGKHAENVDRGIRDHGLTYPIALDNDFAIWQAFGNDAWPTKYLFDAGGRLVKRWVGEGSYHDIETEIRRLLAAASAGTKLPPITPEAMAFARTGEPSYAGITAETYVGSARREPGTFTLEGQWRSSAPVRRAPERHGQDRPSVQGRGGQRGDAAGSVGKSGGRGAARREADRRGTRRRCQP